MFQVSFPRPGRCVVHVETVVHGILEMRLDGRVVLQEKSPGNFGVDVPAGRHETALDNVGSDLVRFD